MVVSRAEIGLTSVSEDDVKPPRYKLVHCTSSVRLQSNSDKLYWFPCGGFALGSLKSPGFHTVKTCETKGTHRERQTDIRSCFETLRDRACILCGRVASYRTGEWDLVMYRWILNQRIAVMSNSFNYLVEITTSGRQRRFQWEHTTALLWTSEKDDGPHIL